MEELLHELLNFSEICKETAKLFENTEVQDIKTNIENAIEKVSKASSNSWMGYHALVYYKDLNPPPPGRHFSVEWGFIDSFSGGTTGAWQENDFDYVVELIKKIAGDPDFSKLKWDEFNRESPAGISVAERLSTMLDDASFAFIVMTSEDEHADKTLHARENVIHEAGLFQGRLGFKKAIILLEEECTEFSNIHGLVQIRFPKRNIESKFEEIRRVLEREEIL